MQNCRTEVRKAELLAPAGDLDKLHIALKYGADAVYGGGELFNLRDKAKNFDIDQIYEAVSVCEDAGKKFYLTLNSYVPQRKIEKLEEYLKILSSVNPHGIIVSDLGVFAIAKKYWPAVEFHLSTQANPSNTETLNMYSQLGFSRAVLSRELTRDDLRFITRSSVLPVEVFVHGAMCVSISGRCLLSSFLSGRSGNEGACTHPCRWKYKLVEETRPEEYFPINESEEHTYIMNSKDLCLAPFVHELIEMGVSSLKIEGRNKSPHYLAVVVGTYRKILDEYYKDPINYKFNPDWENTLKTVDHRDYTTGFYLDIAGTESMNYQLSGYQRMYKTCGVIEKIEENSAFIRVKNRIDVKDEIEILSSGEIISYVVNEIETPDGKKKEYINNTRIFRIPLISSKIGIGDIVRRKARENEL